MCGIFRGESSKDENKTSHLPEMIPVLVGRRRPPFLSASSSPPIDA